MVFRSLHRYALDRVAAFDRTLYVGFHGLHFPKSSTTFRQASFVEGLPYANRSIDYVFGQILDHVPAPYAFQHEVLRTCHRGLLTTRAPHALLRLDLPRNADDDDDVQTFAMWTEPETNMICFLPMSVWSRVVLNHPDVQKDMERWNQLSLFNPLFLFNVYEWDHPMEFNIRVYPAQSDPEEFREWYRQGCKASVRNMQQWLNKLESFSDANK